MFNYSETRYRIPTISLTNPSAIRVCRRGSGESDEENSAEQSYDLEDSFINDGNYTQATPARGGMVMYHELHR